MPHRGGGGEAFPVPGDGAGPAGAGERIRPGGGEGETFPGPGDGAGPAGARERIRPKRGERERGKTSNDSDS